MQDLYQAVTDQILAILEQGTAPWVKPWSATSPQGGMPYNAATGKPYRGINVALLLCQPFASQGWMTYKQAQNLGANVRKGEKGSMIVFFKPFEITDKNSTPNANGDRPSKTIPLLRSYTVFNVSQIDNLPSHITAPVVVPLSADERTSACDAMLSIANIEIGGDRAAYSPSYDKILMPAKSQFTNAADWAATALHELTHWTGHASRLAREYGKRFGEEAYAREELVAEMGSAFLCANVQIDCKLQHAAYLQGWISILKSDKRAIVIAASAAQKAADYVLKHSGAVVDEHNEEAAAA